MQNVKLNFLRILRILRPLKAMKTIPSLRKQIAALLQAMQGLRDVLTFLLFIFLLFGIVGLQWFNGSIHYACRVEDLPTEGSKTWERFGDDYSGICIPEAQQILPQSTASYAICPTGSICGSPVEYNLNVLDDGILSNEDLSFGISSFDNIGQSILAVFQIIFLDGWSQILANLQKNHSIPLIPALYCIVLIFLGSFFLLNLMLAVIMEAYIHSAKKINEDILNQKKEEEHELEERLQKANENKSQNEQQSFYIENESSSRELNIDHPVIAKVRKSRSRSLTLKSEKNLTEEDPQHVPGRYSSQFQHILEECEEINNPFIRSKIKQNMAEIVRNGLLAHDQDMLDDIEQKIESEKVQILGKFTGALQRRYQINDQMRYGLNYEEKVLQDMRNGIKETVSNKFKNVISRRSTQELRYSKEEKMTWWDNLRSQRKNSTRSQKLAEIDEVRQKLRLEEEVLRVRTKFKEYLYAHFRQRLKVEQISENCIEIMRKGKVNIRADNNAFYRFFAKISDSKLFKAFIAICILVNTIILALDKYPQEQGQSLALEKANYFFCAVFFVEMIIKLTGFGFSNYFAKKSNVFDFLIVVLSTGDIVIYFIQDNDASDQFIGPSTETKIGAIVQVFRVFRILRVFKLAKNWYSFNYFLVTISSAISKVASFSVLLYIFMFTYTILGLEMFSHKLRFSFDNEPRPRFEDLDDVSEIKDVPNANFDTFLQGTLLVFIVLTNDGWTNIYFNHYRTVGSITSTLYFVSLVVLGQLILFNLFLAILLQEFDERSMIEQGKGKKEQNSCCKNLYDTCLAQEPDQNTNKSLCLFTEKNGFRRFSKWLAEHKHFESFILFAIIVSSIALGFENPLNDPQGNLVYTLKIIDIITTVFFFIEIIVKIVATGFLFNGKNSYMRDPWHISDFLIVTVSVISFLPLINLNIIKVIRMIRLMRPLRVISKNKNLKRSIKALVISIPSIAGLSIVVLLIWFIFAIIAVNLLKGKSFECNTEHIVGMTQKEIETYIVTKEDCYNYGGIWNIKFYNFDNIGSALFSIFVMTQAVGWSDIMFTSMNSNGPEMVPGQFVAPYYSIFFITFIIFGAFFITNLFIGVVINAFNIEITNEGRNFLLTEEQQSWIQTKMLVLKVQPKLKALEPESKFRKVFFNLAQRHEFDVFILVIICLNTFVLTLKWASMTKETEDIVTNLNIFFTIVFILEAIIKLIAYGKRYFKDSMNIFDFFIVSSSVLFYILNQAIEIKLGTTAQVFRTLRIGRMFKFFKGLKQMRIIFATVINTISSLINVGSLLLLIIYVYAVIGISLFANTKTAEDQDQRVNFQNLTNAFLTLIQMATGENWDILLNQSTRGNTLEHSCIVDATYEDYINAENQPQGCGERLLTYAFLGSYVTFVNTIFLNLFIAIILTGYFESRAQESQDLNETKLKQFSVAWSEFDPNALGFIHKNDFPALMFKLGEPLGWDESYENDKDAQKAYINMVNIPENEQGHYFFHEVLDEITLSYVISNEIELIHEEDPMDLVSEQMYETSDSSSSSELKNQGSPDIHEFSSSSSSSSHQSGNNNELQKSQENPIQNPSSQRRSVMISPSESIEDLNRLPPRISTVSHVARKSDISIGSDYYRKLTDKKKQNAANKVKRLLDLKTTQMSRSKLREAENMHEVEAVRELSDQKGQAKLLRGDKNSQRRKSDNQIQRNSFTITDAARRASTMKKITLSQNSTQSFKSQIVRAKKSNNSECSMQSQASFNVSNQDTVLGSIQSHISQIGQTSVIIEQTSTVRHVIPMPDGTDQIIVQRTRFNSENPIAEETEFSVSSQSANEQELNQ